MPNCVFWWNKSTIVICELKCLGKGKRKGDSEMLGFTKFSQSVENGPPVGSSSETQGLV